MENFALIATIILTLFMTVSFIWHKWPFGVTTMTCCVLLVILGICDVKTAFSGFANQIVILIAPMLVLGSALTKTSLVAKIQKILLKFQEKKGIVLVLGFFLVGAAFVQFIPATATIAIVATFMATLADTGEVTMGRMLLPLLGVLEAWKARLPIGFGATSFAMDNAYYQDITNGQYLLTLLDPLKTAILPTIVLTLYCILCWKLMPKDHKIESLETKSKDWSSTLKPWQEKVVYGCFIGVMLVMILNKWLGSYMYIAPAAAVLVLVYTKVLTVPETVKGLTPDMIWMIAGILTMANVLSSTGVADLIGNGIIGIIGSHPSSLFVMLLFTGITLVMTTFISNTACQAVLTPLAASICMAGGMDPRGIVCAIATASVMVIAFPSGSGEAAATYALGEYNPGKVLKFSIPFMLLAWISIAVGANLIYPIYG